MTPEALAAIQKRADVFGSKEWGSISVLALIEDRDALLEALRESEADNARLLVVVGVLQDMFDLGEEVFAVSNRWPHAKALIDAALAEPSAEGGQA